MKSKWMTIILVLFLMISLTACESGTKKETITISAAASLSDVMKKLAVQYEKKHSNQKILFNFGGSGALSQQILHGAPVDVFLSAAKEPIDLIKNKGLTKEETVLFKNKLVLIVPKNATQQHIEFTDLTDPYFKTIAIGTPKAVPAGSYAKETMDSLGIWGKVKDKLVYGKDVRQVLQYVESNNVQAGFVYYTDALTSKKVRIAAKTKEEWHSPIVYYSAELKSGKHQRETKQFLDFLRSSEAKKIYQKYGFNR